VAHAAPRRAGRLVAYAVHSVCAASFCDPDNVVVHDLPNGRPRFADVSRLSRLGSLGGLASARRNRRPGSER
jgi:hypothetical protein